MATRNAINSDIPIAVTKGGTGLATITDHGILLGSGSSAVTPLGVATDGQLPIGSTGADPTLATITAGSGISVTNGAGTITVTNTAGSGGLSWSEVTGTSQSMSVNNGYVLNNASLITATLPDTAAVGDIVAVAGSGAGGWLVAQNASEIIHFISSDTSTGIGGSLASTVRYDCAELICVVANTEWVVRSATGNLTIV